MLQLHTNITIYSQFQVRATPPPKKTKNRGTEFVLELTIYGLFICDSVKLSATTVLQVAELRTNPRTL